MGLEHNETDRAKQEAVTVIQVRAEELGTVGLDRSGWMK